MICVDCGAVIGGLRSGVLAAVARPRCIGCQSDVEANQQRRLDELASKRRQNRLKMCWQRANRAGAQERADARLLYALR